MDWVAARVGGQRSAGGGGEVVGVRVWSDVGGVKGAEEGVGEDTRVILVALATACWMALRGRGVQWIK